MINGALLVDKPDGMTSFDVIRRLRRKFSFSKIGHSGTLDPFATGLLVVLLGKATRLQDLFLQSNKSYEGIIQLGIRTDTDDITGQVVSSNNQLPSLEVGRALIASLESKFSGEIEQVPPAYSAIKVDGKRSYKLAREKKAPELKPRKVTIEELTLSYPAVGELAYSVRCSKGTYVRSLGRDIGVEIGSGACVKTLRRTFSEPFDVKDAHLLDELLEREAEQVAEVVLPMEQLLGDMPRISITDKECELLRSGDQRPLREVDAGLSNSETYQGLVAICDPSGGLCAFAQKGTSSKGKQTSLSLRFVM